MTKYDMHIFGNTQKYKQRLNEKPIFYAGSEILNKPICCIKAGQNLPFSFTRLNKV
jgi:hypothetical protein